MTDDPEARPTEREATRPAPDPVAVRRARAAVIGVAGGLAVCTLVYRGIMDAGLDQTAALFVGLPAILAITVAMTPPAKSVTGLILKTMTLGLLLAGILVGETLVCLVVAAPLVYLVGLAVGVPMDIRRRRRAQGQAARGPLSIVGLVLFASMEGVIPGTQPDTTGSVTVVEHVDASPAAVAAALARTPRFVQPLPLPLRVGFPRPVAADGGGLDVGDRRRITFVGDAHHGQTHSGDLDLQVTQRGPGMVIFRTVRDDTRTAQWLRWESAEVTWWGDGSGTRVSWTLHYERQLSPSWYFAPVQLVAAGLAASYLIDTTATPGE